VQALCRGDAGRKNTAAARQVVALISKLWLDEKAPKALPMSRLGKATSYSLKLWPGLIT